MFKIHRKNCCGLEVHKTWIYARKHPGESFDVTQFIGRRCKHPASEIQAVKLRECLNHIDELKTHRARIESEILNLAERYALVLNLLRTVSGFSATP